MSHESGSVTASREARVVVRFIDGEEVSCVIDTGFSGELMLPRSVAEQLDLRIIGQEEFETVGTHVLIADISLAEVFWLGNQRTLEVIISDGDDALIGTEMLATTRLSIDYVGGGVAIIGVA